ncbi:MAG: hypothetical protein ACPGVY_12185 [Mycobacterium sp.]
MIIDKRGIARVWSIDEEKWVNRAPIDAREGLEMGVFATQGPQQEAQQSVASQTEEDRIQLLQKFDKRQLQQLCDKNGITWTGNDVKATLVAKLASQGADFELDEDPADNETDPAVVPLEN